MHKDLKSNKAELCCVSRLKSLTGNLLLTTMTWTVGDQTNEKVNFSAVFNSSRELSVFLVHTSKPSSLFKGYIGLHNL